MAVDSQVRTFKLRVSDYEHSGDLDGAVDVLRKAGYSIVDAREILDDDREPCGVISILCTRTRAIEAARLI